MPEVKTASVFGYVMIALAVLFVGIMYVASAKYSVDPNLETVIDDGHITTIDFEHYEIHEGDHFYYCNYETLGNGASKTFSMETNGMNKSAHMTFHVTGTQGINFTIREGAVVSSNGTSITPFNNYRDSNNTALMKLRTGDTFTSQGNIIFKEYAGSNKQAGLIERENEIILKQHTIYIFRITNQETTPNTISYCGEWYEHSFE